MGRSSPAVDRAVRIELLRAKAALERETFVVNVASVGRNLTPGNAMRGLWPGVMEAARASGGTNMAMQAFNLWRRYPMVGSTLSALVLGGGRKSHLLKAIVVGVAGWKLYQGFRASNRSDDAPVE